MSRILTAVFAATALALCALPAIAKDTPAVARERADRIIQAAHAEGLFENISTGSDTMVRHKASGLVCYFDGHPGENIAIYDSAVRGTDVSCGMFPHGAVFTLYAMKPPNPVTLDQAFAGYVDEVRHAHPDTRPYTGKLSEIQFGTPPGLKPLPAIRSARFLLTMNGQPSFSRLAVAIVNGWVVEERLTAPVVPILTDQYNQNAETLGEKMMVGALDMMINRR